MEIRNALRSALRNSAGILLTTVLAIPFFSVINRVSEGRWRVAWREMLAVSGVVTFVFFLFWFVSFAAESLANERRERLGIMAFPGLMWVRNLASIGVAMGIFGAIGAYRQGQPYRVSLLMAAFIPLGILLWPRSIRFQDGKIRQGRPFFLPAKEIPYHEVQSTSFNVARREIFVFGKNDVRIVHTSLHAAPERFVRELQSLTGREVNWFGMQR